MNTITLKHQEAKAILGVLIQGVESSYHPALMRRPKFVLELYTDVMTHLSPLSVLTTHTDSLKLWQSNSKWLRELSQMEIFAATLLFTVVYDHQCLNYNILAERIELAVPIDGLAVDSALYLDKENYIKMILDAVGQTFKRVRQQTNKSKTKAPTRTITKKGSTTAKSNQPEGKVK